MSLVPTILELINQVMDSGEFVPSPKDEIAEGEELIGFILNREEKAIFTVLDDLIDEYNEYVEKFNSGCFEKEEEIMEYDRLCVFKQKLDVLNSLLWVNIRERIVLEKIECDIDRIAIRSGYEVVEILEEEDAASESEVEIENWTDEDEETIQFPMIIFSPTFKGSINGYLEFPIPERPELN